jgi:zinc finger protein
MTSNNPNESKLDGAAFDEFFDSIGKKVENTDKQNGTFSGAEPQGTVTEVEDEPKVVDEIESLCMNCHENVSYFLSLNVG